MKQLLKQDKLAESFSIAMLLALVGGYLDIYSYLARGKVFANTQTGNLVLLGYNIAQGNLEKILYYILPISSFVGGIWLAKIIEYKMKEGKYFDWLHFLLGIEIVVLFIVMFIPEGKLNVIANIMVSFVCALQVQGFRKVNGNSYSTVMFTGNLKNVAERFSHYSITKESDALENGMIYLGITLMFVIGGWLGALITMEYEAKAVGLVNIVLGLVFILLYIEKRRDI
ncbi:YoaK family protein [Niameybacter massiliensis]|uniref:YoaK family protein n=1 Tax=Holtiella tumoricola TaxID=3018743 RepID=A0AA42J2A8_9FIRM|nr:YoaK family protein [Holtiella tumoricola]MDA3733008.1 YoaK family protein [Holtiella tumoricola]